MNKNEPFQFKIEHHQSRVIEVKEAPYDYYTVNYNTDLEYTYLEPLTKTKSIRNTDS